MVLGGGGVTGIAWDVGLILGLAEAGVDLSQADLFVGTSAGAAVASQLAGGVSLEKLFEAQLARDSSENAEKMSSWATARFLMAMAWPGRPEQARARLGRAALRTKAVSKKRLREVIGSQMVTQEWPERRLLITTVNAATGEFVVFDRDSGVPLVDALTASCAVPLVWPPATIKGERYMDGGVRSVGNVDLAKGYGRVVVIAPITQALRRADRPASQLAALGQGVRAVMISPDAVSRGAIGSNPLDPARRAPSARAGRVQALAEAERVGAVWS